MINWCILGQEKQPRTSVVVTNSSLLVETVELEELIVRGSLGEVLHFFGGLLESLLLVQAQLATGIYRHRINTYFEGHVVVSSVM